MDRQLLTVDDQMNKIEKSIDNISAHLDLIIKRETFLDKIITMLTYGTGFMITVIILATLTSLTH